MYFMQELLQQELLALKRQREDLQKARFQCNVVRGLHAWGLG